jgi:O-antigen ligase
MTPRTPGSQPQQERLAFSFRASVPARRAGGPAPTFATVPYNEPRDWGYTGLLAFTAVLFIRPQEDIPALAALHLAEVCALVGIAPMLLHRFARRMPAFRVTAETTALMIFAATILVTAPFSIWPGGVVTLFTETFAKVLIVFALMMNTLTTVKRIQQITWLIVLCCGYSAARGVFDYARGMNLVEDGRLTGAVGGIFGNPNDLALNMVAFMPLAAIVVITRGQPTFRRLLAAGFFVLMAATVVFTKSRSGTVGLVAMLIALVVLARAVKPTLVVAVVSIMLIATPFMPATFWARMASAFDSEQDATQFTGSREARSVLLQEGIATFLERPLTGVGAGQFVNYNRPGRKEQWKEAHNVVIQVAADLGIVGVVAFVFLIGRAGHAAIGLRRLMSPRRNRRDPPVVQVVTEAERRILHGHAVALGAALIGWFTCALFASVAYSWTFYYLLALTVAARELVRDRMAAVEASAAVDAPRTPRHAVRAATYPVTA